MIQSPNLDNQQFKEIFDAMLLRMSQYYKGDLDISYQDPGVALLELFCLFKDMQQYYLNYIGDKHYSKYLKLLSYKKENVKYSKTYLEIELNNDMQRYLLPADFPVYTGETFFETEKAILISRNKIKRLLLADGEEITDYTALNDDYEKSFKFFGCPAKEGNKLYIGFEEDISENQIEGLFFNLDSVNGTFENFTPLGKIKIEYLSSDNVWRELNFTDETLCFSQIGYIRFDVDSKMSRAKFKSFALYWIRIILYESYFELSPSTVSIKTNIASALQKRTYRSIDGDFEPVVGSSNGTPNQCFEINIDGFDPKSLRLQVSSCDWTLVESFDTSGCNDNHYIYENGKIIFGNGLNGALPEKGKDNIKLLSYVKTLGSGGNIKKCIFKSDKAEHLSIRSIINSYGGHDVQTVKEALELANDEKIQKAVICEDYEKLLLSMPFIALDAVSVTGELGVINIIAKPKSDTPLPCLSPVYIKNIKSYIEKYRIITTEVRIQKPEYFPLTISLEVETVKTALNPRARIENCIAEMYPSAEQTKNMKNISFGKTISYGELYGAISNLACVRRVKNIFLKCGGKTVQNGDISIPRNGIVYLTQSEIVNSEY